MLSLEKGVWLIIEAMHSQWKEKKYRFAIIVMGVF